jgi:hypothetical protein
MNLMVQWMLRRGETVAGPHTSCGILVLLLQQGDSMRLRHELQFGAVDAFVVRTLLWKLSPERHDCFTVASHYCRRRCHIVAD